MESVKDTCWKQANRHFYALARQCNMSREDIAATISGNYPPRVSTSELTAAELRTLCLALQRRAVSPWEQQKDRWRKRLIAAVRHYLELMGYQTDIDYVRSVIERDGTALNDLSLDRLRSLYNAFTKRAKDLQTGKTPTSPTPPKEGLTDSPMSFATAEA